MMANGNTAAHSRVSYTHIAIAVT